METYDYIEDLKKKLREEGFKLTPQRRSVVDVLYQKKGNHLSCEEIYNLVKVTCPEIGLATIYRTLQMLDKIGFITKLSLDDGCLRYEYNEQKEGHHHHHLICRKCGKIYEAEVDLLEPLEQLIEESYKFKIEDHDVKFYGICSQCSEWDCISRIKFYTACMWFDLIHDCIKFYFGFLILFWKEINGIIFFQNKMDVCT